MIRQPNMYLPVVPLLFLVLTGVLPAEEGGSGHYMPGSAASFIDALPGRPSVSVVDFFTSYQGDVGFSRWTFEPCASVSWLSSKIGLEISAFAGFDFNTRNEDTDYTTGTQFHLDFTVAEHLPLWGGFIGIGFNGFCYDQITGDSGTGAKLGDFTGRTLGVGPVLSYATKLCGKYDLVSEIKWLPELDVAKRTNGDYVWCKFALVF